MEVQARESAYQAAKKRLKNAEDAFARAQTELILARRDWNDALHEIANKWFHIPALSEKR